MNNFSPEDILIEEKRMLWEETRDRVNWWLNDMANKPPEVLTGRYGTHYFKCMAEDIANHVVDEEWGLNSVNRLDP